MKAHFIFSFLQCPKTRKYRIMCSVTPINAILNYQKMVDIICVQSVWLFCMRAGGSDMMSSEHAQDASSQKEQVSIDEVAFFLHRLASAVRSHFERSFGAYFCTCFFVLLHQGAC